MVSMERILIKGHLQVILKAKISPMVFWKETGPTWLLLSRVERKLHFMSRHQKINRDTVSGSFPLNSKKCNLLSQQRLSSNSPEERKRENTIWSVTWKWRQGTERGIGRWFQCIQEKLITRRYVTKQIEFGHTCIRYPQITNCPILARWSIA